MRTPRATRGRVTVPRRGADHSSGGCPSRNDRRARARRDPRRTGNRRRPPRRIARRFGRFARDGRTATIKTEERDATRKREHEQVPARTPTSTASEARRNLPSWVDFARGSPHTSPRGRRRRRDDSGCGEGEPSNRESGGGGVRRGEVEGGYRRLGFSGFSGADNSSGSSSALEVAVTRRWVRASVARAGGRRRRVGLVSRVTLSKEVVVVTPNFENFANRSGARQTRAAAGMRRPPRVAALALAACVLTCCCSLAGGSESDEDAAADALLRELESSPTTPRPRGHPLGGGRSGTGPPTPPTASGKTTLAFDAGKSHGARRSSTRGAARTPAPCPGRPSRRARVASSEWWTRAPTTAATTTPAPRAPRIVPTSCPRRYLPRLPRTLPRLHFHRPRHPLPPGRPRRPLPRRASAAWRGVPTLADVDLFVSYAGVGPIFEDVDRYYYSLDPIAINATGFTDPATDPPYSSSAHSAMRNVPPNASFVYVRLADAAGTALGRAAAVVIETGSHFTDQLGNGFGTAARVRTLYELVAAMRDPKVERITLERHIGLAGAPLPPVAGGRHLTVVGACGHPAGPTGVNNTGTETVSAGAGGAGCSRCNFRARTRTSITARSRT